jgi:hypothetical protein
MLATSIVSSSFAHTSSTIVLHVAEYLVSAWVWIEGSIALSSHVAHPKAIGGCNELRLDISVVGGLQITSREWSYQRCKLRRRI